MQFTELLVRPAKHKWELSVAYLFRLANLNRTNYPRIARSVFREYQRTRVEEDLFRPPVQYGIFHEGLSAIGRSVGAKASRPGRQICPLCISNEHPDSLNTEKYPYLEYCLVHGCAPVSECPACRVELRYGCGSYAQCECGFELALARPRFADSKVLSLYKAVATQIPLGIKHLHYELEQSSLISIHGRLLSTWRHFWRGHLPRSVHEDPEIARIYPPVGRRWETAWNTLAAAAIIETTGREKPPRGDPMSLLMANVVALPACDAPILNADRIASREVCIVRE